MKSNKHFFIFVYAKPRGGISSGAYFVRDGDAFIDADAFTCRADAFRCALFALERALLVAQFMDCDSVTICADELTLESIKDNGAKALRRFSHVNFETVENNPAKKLADAAFFKRMGW